MQDWIKEQLYFYCRVIVFLESSISHFKGSALLLCHAVVWWPTLHERVGCVVLKF